MKSVLEILYLTYPANKWYFLGSFTSTCVQWLGVSQVEKILFSKTELVILILLLFQPYSFAEMLNGACKQFLEACNGLKLRCAWFDRQQMKVALFNRWMVIGGLRFVLVPQSNREEKYRHFESPSQISGTDSGQNRQKMMIADFSFDAFFAQESWLLYLCLFFFRIVRFVRVYAFSRFVNAFMLILNEFCLN